MQRRHRHRRYIEGIVVYSSAARDYIPAAVPSDAAQEARYPAGTLGDIPPAIEPPPSQSALPESLVSELWSLAWDCQSECAGRHWTLAEARPKARRAVPAVGSAVRGGAGPAGGRRAGTRRQRAPTPGPGPLAGWLVLPLSSCCRLRLQDSLLDEQAEGDVRHLQQGRIEFVQNFRPKFTALVQRRSPLRASPINDAGSACATDRRSREGRRDVASGPCDRKTGDLQCVRDRSLIQQRPLIA